MCNVCQLSIANPLQWQSHCSGKKHQKNVQNQNRQHVRDVSVAIGEDMDDDEEYIVYDSASQWRKCSLCSVIFTSACLEKSHMAGKRHRKNVKLAKQLSTGNFEDPLANNPKCELCNIVFNSDDQYRAHINGRRHIKMCWWHDIPTGADDEWAAEDDQWDNWEPPSEGVKLDPASEGPVLQNSKSTDVVMKEPGDNGEANKGKVMKDHVDRGGSKENDHNVLKSEQTEIKSKGILTKADLESYQKSSKTSESVNEQLKIMSNENSKKMDVVGEQNSKSLEEKTETMEKDASGKTSLLKDEIREAQKSKLPHVLLEKKIEETYRLYARTVYRSPVKVKKLYDEYMQLYADYDVEYEKYLSETDSSGFAKENGWSKI